MSPAWIAAALTAAGAVALCWFAPRASAAEIVPTQARPWVLWQCPPDRVLCQARGTNESETGCALDAASLAFVVPSGTRVYCQRAKETKG